MSDLAKARDVAFSPGVMRAFAFCTGVDPEAAFDRMFEQAIHSLSFLDTALSEASRRRLHPFLDLMTALQLEADMPVGTGVMRGYSLGLHIMALQLWDRLRATGPQACRA